jgi:hypothetical protein
MTLSRVRAHHQNGVAKCAIQMVMWKARTMMIHLQLLWPDHFKTSLWCFALTYATWIHNHAPTHDLGFAPIKLFSGIQLHCHDLCCVWVFGCSSYVLDPRLQDNFTITSWDPQGCLGQFLSFSSHHSSNIGLIRNLNTGFVSPQYHVLYDESFTSVASTQLQDPD